MPDTEGRLSETTHQEAMVSRPPDGDQETDLARLGRELDEVKGQLWELQKKEKQSERTSAERIATLEKDLKAARAYTLDAGLARIEAEGKLRALRAAIMGVPGLSGWLLRRAARKLVDSAQ
ncbi:hypothetical protein [Roseomonas sp. BN140053]|uniref:hypothetical protein n=1 Tax=Roseomonas sp. BN140053 TaxID=3391898 RepID=UPI0039EA575C